jgi:transposase
MQALSKDTPTVEHYGTIFIALELSQRSWLVTLHCPDRDKISRHRLEGGDHAGLLALVDRVRARSAAALGGVPAVVSCYEAGYDGFWLHRLLMAAGITNHVFDPASIAVDQRARRVKTDRIDGNEVFYKDFRNRREVASYFGLTPSPWQSGGIDRDQGISKAGNPRARRAAIELSWLWLRHQPESALTRWLRDRTRNNASKRNRRIAIVALARKLVVALWRYLTTGLVPEGATLKAAKA